MRKFWRIGLVAVIGLVVYGEARADQAQDLQKEIQSVLASAAGSDKALTYGDVTVTPEGDSFAVTIDKIAVAPPDIKPIEIGKVGFKVTPDGDDLRKFSDVTLPAAVTFKDPDGKEIKIAVTLDHATGTWSKKMSLLLAADILVRSIEASEVASDSRALASDIFYKVDSTDDGQGVYDQKGSFGSKLLTIGDKDGQVAIADLKFDTAVSGAQLAALVALKPQMQAAAKHDKPNEILPILSKMAQLLKAFKMGLSVGQISVATGGSQVFSLKHFNFDFAMNGTDQPKVKIVSSTSYAGLVVPDMKAEAGGMASEVIPTEFAMTATVDDLPMSAILANLSKAMPDAAMTDENAAAGMGMMAMGAAMQAIQESPATLTITDGSLKAPGLTGSFSGEVKNDANAPMGFIGSADVELSDLDALIAKGQQYANEPATAEIVGTLHLIRALSNRGTDASGQPVDRYKITMDAQGNPLINGKPLMPPSEQPPSSDQPPPAEQPSDGENGAGKSGGTSGDTGTTSP